MSRSNKVLRLMGGAILTFAAAYSDTLSFFKQIAQAAAESPVRAALIAIGIVLIISAFWENLLDAAGIHSDKRLLTKITSWLHFSLGYGLVKTTLRDNSFTVITEYQNRLYIITKDELLPILKISTQVISGDSKEILKSIPISEQASLKEDLAIELSQLDLYAYDTSFKDGVFQTTVASSVTLSKDFDQLCLIEGIITTQRAARMVTYLYGRWARQHLPTQSQTEQST